MEFYSTNFVNPKYKDEIISVDFTPIKEYELQIAREKGKRYWWKFLGFIPIFPYTAKKNKYFSEYGIFKRDINEMFLELKEHIFSDKYFKRGNEEKIYYKACVRTKYMNKSSNYTYDDRKYFVSNKDARNYYDKILSEIKKD